MRYWGYLGAKAAVAAAVLYGLPVWFSRGAPAVPHRIFFAPTLPDILAMMGWFLLAAGALYLIAWDQRHRCRTCLRRLRMPVETGSWGFMLQLGRPRIEYICAYGHGTLKEEELQISGLASPEWTAHSDDYLEALSASNEQSGKD